MRALAGTEPDAPDLAALAGELLVKSPDFARLWERYDVTTRPAGQKKTFHHPHVGTITLSFQGMQLEGTPGQRLGVYTAEPCTPDHDAMVLLDMTAPRLGESPAAPERLKLNVGTEQEPPAVRTNGFINRTGGEGKRPVRVIVRESGAILTIKRQAILRRLLLPSGQATGNDACCRPEAHEGAVCGRHRQGNLLAQGVGGTPGRVYDHRPV